MTRFLESYNGNDYENLMYNNETGELTRGGNKFIPWRIHVRKVKNKAGEITKYLYEVAIVQDINGKKHKIYKSKLSREMLN